MRLAAPLHASAHVIAPQRDACSALLSAPQRSAPQLQTRHRIAARLNSPRRIATPMAKLDPRRENCVTASFVPNLMAGDETEIYLEWQRLVGDPEYVPKDLSRNWAVQHGVREEQPALDWHEISTGEKLIRRGEFVLHPTLDYVSATIDSYRVKDDCVVEFKAIGGWQKLADVIAHYAPQVYVQRACAQASRGVLLIEHGGAEPQEYEIEFDAGYEEQIFERIEEFWSYVCDLTPPVVFPPKVPPEKMRTIDLDYENPNWGSEMRTLLEKWDRKKDDADAFAEATDSIKKLLPIDVGKLTCGGLAIARNRANAVSIRRAR